MKFSFLKFGMVAALGATMYGSTGCYYDVEEELYGNTNCDTAVVTLSATVVPILQTNCYSCHSAAANNGGVTLEGYANLLTYVNNGKLVGSLRHVSGFSAMPKNSPQLVECDLIKIEKWVNDGALNN